jgi:hypothetical protein
VVPDVVDDDAALTEVRSGRVDLVGVPTAEPSP